MYDFSVKKQAAGTSGDDALALLAQCTPPGHTVRAATSALAKVLAYAFESPLGKGERLAHQADYCASLLTCYLSSTVFHSFFQAGPPLRPPRLLPRTPVRMRLHTPVRAPS